MKLFNKDHLNQATAFSNQTSKAWLVQYVWHFLLSFSEGIKLLLLSLGSFIHAVFPWILDFQLLKWRILMLKDLKKKLPNDPNLQKIDFLD